MFGSVCRVRIAFFTLLFSAAGIAAVGCAEGIASDSDDLLPETGPADAAPDGKKGRPDAADAAMTSDQDAAGDDGDDGDDDDAGIDAGAKDAGGKDAGAKDAATDASVKSDAGADAGADAAAEAGSDAGSDAGTQPSDDGGAAATKPVQGEVVLSEVMYNPLGTEPDTEWLEVYNTANGPRLLSGLVIRDGSNRSHTIAANVVAPPGAYVVLASVRSAVVASGVPDAVIVYEYNAGPGTQVQLANSSGGEVVLLDGATEIARSHYGTFGMSSADNGQSIQLRSLDYASAGTKANWCYSSKAWAVGSGKGTPGSPSDCP